MAYPPGFYQTKETLAIGKHLGPFVYAFQCLTGKFDNDNDKEKHSTEFDEEIVKFLGIHQTNLSSTGGWFSRAVQPRTPGLTTIAICSVGKET